MKNTVLLFILSIALFSCMYKDNTAVSSPNNSNTFYLHVSDSSIAYSVYVDDTLRIKESSISFNFKQQASLAQNLEIKKVEKKSVNETWQRVWGRSKNVINHYNQTVFFLEEKTEPFRKINITVRAYNEGIAFRCEFPEQSNLNEFTLLSENVEFNFADNYYAWPTFYPHHFTAMESEFEKQRLSDMDTSKVIGCPFLVKTGNNLWLSVTEANLVNWSGLAFRKNGSKENSIISELGPFTKGANYTVKTKTPVSTPWRLIMVANNPGKMAEYNILHNLNEPCAFDDVSWIKPGKSAWDWWWSNRYAPEVDFEVGSNTQTMKYYVDLAAENGWDYQIIDWHWYGDPFLPDTVQFTPDPTRDITKPTDIIDIPEIVNYAQARDVKIILWLHWFHANRQMDEAFALYEKWGVAGVKVDFMDSHGQQTVDFYHRLLKKAAEHKLVVDFHGAYKPTGISRTYPNLITREGVLGNEYNKWSHRINPEHNVEVAFTRAVLGETDYTPGAFVNVTPKNFKLQWNVDCPMVKSTRCHQLAITVAYESAFLVLCDAPHNYRNNAAGIEFINQVPVTWDETNFLSGDPETYFAIARRSGDNWYVGALNNSTAREIEVDFSFLEAGEYSATIWKDAKDADRTPTNLIKEELELNANTKHTIRMAVGGGFTMAIAPRDH